MSEQTQTRSGMSLDDFLKRADTQRFEIINGNIIEMAPTKKPHSKVSKRIYDRILFYLVEQNKGEVFFETTYVTTDRSDWVKGARIPDVSFYEQSRYEAHEASNPDEDEKPFLIAPDFVVEIISPTDSYSKIEAKIRAYLSDGVPLIWIVDPQNHTVKVYAGRSEADVRQPGDALSGRDVLPGFTLPVADVFDI